MTPLERRNAIFNVLGASFWGLPTGVVAASTVLTVLLRDLGAGNKAIGWVSAIEAGGAVLPQVAGAYLLRFHRNRKLKLVAWYAVAVVPVFFAMGLLAHFSPGMSPGAVRAGLLLCLAGSTIAVGMITPPWIDWIADIFETRIRGRVTGMCLSASAAVSSLGALLAAWLIQQDGRPQGYARHYYFAGAGALLSLTMFLFLRDGESEGVSQRKQERRDRMWDHFRQSLRDANFRAFLIGRMLAATGFAIVPFMTVYYTDEAGRNLPKSFVVSCSFGQMVAMSASFYFFGRLGDSRGHRPGMIVCAMVQVATLAALLLTSGPMGCVAAYALAGVAQGAGIVSQFNMLLETCPHDGRVAHITAGNLLHSAAVIAAPLLWGVVAERSGTPAVFAICLALSLAALAWIVFRLREPRTGMPTA